MSAYKLSYGAKQILKQLQNFYAENRQQFLELGNISEKKAFIRQRMVAVSLVLRNPQLQSYKIPYQQFVEYVVPLADKFLISEGDDDDEYPLEQFKNDAALISQLLVSDLSRVNSPQIVESKKQIERMREFTDQKIQQLKNQQIDLNSQNQKLYKMVDYEKADAQRKIALANAQEKRSAALNAQRILNLQQLKASEGKSYMEIEQEFKPDSSLDINNDVQDKKASRYVSREQYLSAAEQGLGKINFDTEEAARQKTILTKERAQSRRNQKTATEDEAVAYINKHIASFSDAFKQLLKRIFNGVAYQGNVSGKTVDKDLVIAILEGFLSYTSGKPESEKRTTTISVRRMYKPSINASSYDRSVLNKAKRIVKMIKSAIAQTNIRADIPIDKDYISNRAAYNDTKIIFDQRQKAGFIKRIAKKYGTADENIYKSLATSAIKDGLLDASQQAIQKVQNSTKFNQFANPSTSDISESYRAYFKKKLK